LKKQEPGIWIAKEKKKKKGKRAGLQKSIIRMLVAQQVVPTKQTKSAWEGTTVYKGRHLKYYPRIWCTCMLRLSKQLLTMWVRNTCMVVKSVT
jgi:hypothetical protein